jgi:hypothetical protein
MRRLVLFMMALAMVTASGAVAPAIAEDDNGKAFVEGAFHSLGTAGAVVEFGAAALATPQAEDHWNSVRIFGYEDGPSEGQVYCGDVWNVIVTMDFQPVREWFDGNFVTHAIDAGDPVVADLRTPVRWSSTFGVLTQAHGTLLPPGTLSDGSHAVTQTLEHPYWGVLWDPDPVSFEVNDSAC